MSQPQISRVFTPEHQAAMLLLAEVLCDPTSERIAELDLRGVPGFTMGSSEKIARLALGHLRRMVEAITVTRAKQLTVRPGSNLLFGDLAGGLLFVLADYGAPEKAIRFATPDMTLVRALPLTGRYVLTMARPPSNPVMFEREGAVRRAANHPVLRGHTAAHLMRVADELQEHRPTNPTGRSDFDAYIAVVRDPNEPLSNRWIALFGALATTGQQLRLSAF